MKASTLITLAGLHGPFTVSRAEAVATKMRLIGLLPKGGRGPHAPNIDCIQAAAYMLVLAGSEKVDDVPDLVTAILEMVDESGEAALLFVGRHLASSETAYAIRCIRIFGHLPMLEIEFRESDTPSKRFFLPNLWKEKHFNPQAQASGYVGRMGYIGGGVFHQLGIDFEHGVEFETGEIVPE